jgi:hypothetical protein
MAELLAPDMQHEVQQTINDHPEIDTMDEEARGEIIDITDWRVNHGLDKPWGRKARNNDPANPNLNTDGMTFLRPDGLFEIYDCIAGTDGQSMWAGYGPFAPGENGYWWPPQPVEDQPTPPTPPAGDLVQRVTALEVSVANLESSVHTLSDEMATLSSKVSSLEAAIAGGFHARGPANLAVVVESLTSMRAKGDIDVNVLPGQAPPPQAAPPDEGINGKALWLWLRRHQDEDAEPAKPPKPPDRRR